MNKLPIKMILYKDLLGTNMYKLVPVEQADDILIDLMLGLYTDVKFAWAGTPEETMYYLGRES